MASTVDELTINYEEDGVLVVKVLDKVVLSKGAWATILYKFQQWDRAKNDYGPERYSIRRYRKIDDEYRQQAKFTISSKDQATKLIEALQKWIAESKDIEVGVEGGEEKEIKEVKEVKVAKPKKAKEPKE